MPGDYREALLFIAYGGSNLNANGLAEYAARSLERGGGSTEEPSSTTGQLKEAPVPGRHRHYKGGVYNVLGTAAHTETGESLVVYQGADRRLWARPLAMWSEQIGGLPRFSPMAAELLCSCGAMTQGLSAHVPGCTAVENHWALAIPCPHCRVPARQACVSGGVCALRLKAARVCPICGGDCPARLGVDYCDGHGGPASAAPEGKAEAKEDDRG